MARSPWFLHPILIFVISILALATSLILYIYWYIEASTGLNILMEKFDLDADQVLASETWIVILVLSILVGVILMGIFIIFVYNLKTLQLYRRQNNFINNFTHELKTPVTSLRLYLETFARHELSRESQLKYIDYMIQDTVRLNGTINSILDLARIENKSYGGNFLLKDLRAAVENFLAENAHLLEKCKIDIFFPDHQAFFYRIDPVLFDMLLMNIVNNAVKYNRSGNPTLSIGIKARPGKILMEFADNGIGLDKQDLKNVFKKFYQVGHADNMMARGSGIGLYLAQTVARFHGGNLSAHSRGPDQGSLFTLSLPDKYSMPEEDSEEIAEEDFQVRSEEDFQVRLGSKIGNKIGAGRGKW